MYLERITLLKNCFMSLREISIISLTNIEWLLIKQDCNPLI